MASKHVLNLSSILEFFKDDAKLVARGENAVGSGHLKDMAFDGELLIIRGNVHASMRDRLYKVEIKLDTDKCIEEASCTCPRGQLVCHHMGALSIFGYHNISVTDITCTWKSRKPHTNAVQTIDELYSTKPHTSTNGMLSEENILKFKSDLGKLQNAVGFTWLLRSVQAYSEIVADVESIVFSQEFLEVDDKRMFLENALLVTEEVIKEISNKTVGQTSNESWLIIRKTV